MTVHALRPRLTGGPWVHNAVLLLAGTAAAGAAFAISVAVPSPRPAVIAAAAALTALAVWMVVSSDYHLTLAALLLWLGLFDGFVRLKTGTSQLTLIRDVLLYSVVVGWLVRASVRGQSVRLPPLAGWVVAFVAIVVVQVFNPGNASLSHSAAALRPHLEWVPLFFFGYLVMRTRQRLRVFVLLLLAVALVNGAVGVYQSQLTPDELAKWGPGYAERINGTGDVSGRVGFASNSEETAFVRPFGLGSDIGFGGAVGVLALPAALALLALRRRRGVPWGTLVLAAGAITAIATSQSRTMVLSAIAATLAFMALAIVAGHARRVLVGLAVVGVVAFVIAPDVGSVGGFNRYASISPGRAVTTTVDYRRKSFSYLPEYIQKFPFGAGLGSVGPAGGLVNLSGSLSIKNIKELDAENELNFLVVELGVPGLLVMLLFNLRLLGLALTRLRRVHDTELRLLLAAVAAPLFGIVVSWITGAVTATAPNAPYLWFAAGTLAYWLAGRETRQQSQSAPAAL